MGTVRRRVGGCRGPPGSGPAHGKETIGAVKCPALQASGRLPGFDPMQKDDQASSGQASGDPAERSKREVFDQDQLGTPESRCKSVGDKANATAAADNGLVARGVPGLIEQSDRGHSLAALGEGTMDQACVMSDPASPVIEFRCEVIDRADG